MYDRIGAIIIRIRTIASVLVIAVFTHTLTILVVRSGVTHCGSVLIKERPIRPPPRRISSNIILRISLLPVKKDGRAPRVQDGGAGRTTN